MTPELFLQCVCARCSVASEAPDNLSGGYHNPYRLSLASPR